MEIKRDYYLQKLIDSQNNGLVKIITGIRRCGKSYLLNTLFSNYLIKKGIQKSHIVKIDFDSPKNKKYHDSLVLFEYLESLIKDKKTYYFLLDEIQIVNEFESVLNGLLRIQNVDIYVTGSNSKFLSSDIITEFRGRGDEIRVYPLSFSEFCSIKKNKNNINEAWEKYYTYGGLPLVALETNIKKKTDYLKYQTSNIYLNDIIDRYNIKHTDILSTIIEIISSNISSLTNPKIITDTFNTELKIPVTNKTVGKYLDYLEDAFLIQKTKRYDIKGRRYIGTPMKYYFTDMGIRNSLLNFRQTEQDHIMENIIYNELKIRGYSVDIGVVEVNEKNKKGDNIRKQLEVDFVCNNISKRYYIQSALSIPTREKMKQETKSLTKIKDSFKKVVIVKDSTITHQNDDGILIINIYDFLLNLNSLNF